MNTNLYLLPVLIIILTCTLLFLQLFVHVEGRAEASGGGQGNRVVRRILLNNTANRKQKRIGENVLVRASEKTGNERICNSDSTSETFFIMRKAESWTVRSKRNDKLQTKSNTTANT